MNYEIFLIQNKIDEINKLPNIEDLYDMDKESLLKLKQLFDKKFPKLLLICEKEKQKTEKLKKTSSNFNDIDLDLDEAELSDEELELREFKLNAEEDEIDLPRLYSFLLSEIKQREYQEGIVSFFLNEDSLLKLTENNFSLNSNFSIRSNASSTKDSNLLADDKSNFSTNMENNVKTEDKNKSSFLENSVFDERNNNNFANIIKDFDPSECSLKTIKEKLHSKSSKLAIMQMLMKTKQNNTKILVGTNNTNNYSNISVNKTSVATSDKRVSSSNIQIIQNANQNNNNNNDKAIFDSKAEKGMRIVLNNLDSKNDSILKKKKKKKREDTVDKKNKKDDSSSYIKRKNFHVPEIKSFISIKKDISDSKDKNNALKDDEKEKNNKMNTVSKNKFRAKTNEKLISSKQVNNILQVNKGIKSKELKYEISNDFNNEKNVVQKDSENKIDKSAFRIKNIINIRDSLKVCNYSKVNKNISLSRSLDIKIHKELFEKKTRNKTVLVNKSLACPIELTHSETQKLYNGIKKKKEFTNKENDKANINIEKKNFKKDKKIKNILSKSDGDIKIKSDTDINQKTKAKKEKKIDSIRDNREKEENSDSENILTNDKVSDQNNDLKKQQIKDLVDKKNTIESQNILNGEMNSSANPEMISKIKKVTDEMLLKYDSCKLDEPEEKEQEASIEDEDWNEQGIENDNYSAFLKIDEFERMNKLNQQDIENNEQNENKININNHRNTSDNKYYDKEIEKKRNKIEIFGSSGLKDADEDNFKSKNKFETDKINLNFDCDSINIDQYAIENDLVNIKTHSNKNNQEDFHSNDKAKQEDLLFYESEKKNVMLPNEIQVKHSKAISYNKPINKINNQNKANKDSKSESKQTQKNHSDQKESKAVNNKKQSQNQKDRIEQHQNQSNKNQSQKETQDENNESSKKDNKNATTNYFNIKNLNKTGSLKLTNYKQSRAYSGRVPLYSLQKQKIIINNAIPDYTKHFGSFNEILNGFFIPADSKGFDAEGALRMLYENYKNLYIFELKEETSCSKANLINRNIVEAENEIIKNRIRKVSEFLLNDQNYLSEERYYIFQKIQELQKKEAYDLHSNFSNNDINNDYNNNQQENDQNQLSETINKNMEFFRKNKMFFRVVLSRPEIYDIMCYTLGKKHEWRELPHGLLLGQSWNLLWTYSSPGINFSSLFTWQKVNHFINNRQLSRKDLLKKSLERVKKMNPKLTGLFDIMPKTYILAKEYLDFVDEFTRNKNTPNNLWIVKPVGKSRGRGIYLIKELCDVPMVDSFLVQKYLTTPFLIDGFKFDMRIYVLLTSVNPLEAFLYKDGFARVSSMKFSVGNIDNKLVHLTNAAIQNKHAAKGQSYEKVFGGSKISLELLKQKMHRAAGVNFDKQIWPQIKSIVLKSLVACQHDMPHCPSSFELFGYDVIIDQELKCWLLEVNSSPSLDRTSVLDDAVKLQLVDDILNLVNPMNFDRNALLEVLERRLGISKSANALVSNKGNNCYNNGSTTSGNVYLYSPSVQLNLDLNCIFKGEMPRLFGEMPKKIGNFEMIAPSDEASYLIKITGGEKKYINKKS